MKVTFWSDQEPKEELFVPAHLRPGTIWTKPSGGLWTCPESSDYRWIHWCHDEEFLPQDPETYTEWILEIDDSARWYTIDTYEDLDLLYSRFPNESDELLGLISYVGVDWNKIREAYDVIHLTEQGQWSTRLTHPLNLYGWDLESVLMLNWKVI